MLALSKFNDNLSLSDKVLGVIKPIFDNLSSEDLYFGSEIQNDNESDSE